MGKPKKPTFTRDNLRSEDFVELMLAICEGPIEGLEDGEKSFIIGETS